MSFTPNDRESFESDIREWVREGNHSMESYVIYPEGRAAFKDDIKASAVVTVAAKTTDSDGFNLDPNLCDCGKGEACPLWGWVGGSSKWTAILRDDDKVIWWEQRAMV